MGFRVTHLYGLTETYGPATLCAWQDEWASMGLDERARSRWRARACATRRWRTLRVADPETGATGAARTAPRSASCCCAATP